MSAVNWLSGLDILFTPSTNPLLCRVKSGIVSMATIMNTHPAG